MCTLFILGDLFEDYMWNALSMYKLTQDSEEEISYIREMTGKMSIESDTDDSQLEVIVEIEKNKYTKHFIGISDNVSYVVEDITEENVSDNYTINFNPSMWMPNVDKVQ